MQPGERQYPGQVYVTIGPVRRNLPFDRKDSTVTLLKNDQVLINLLTDIITEKTRATNIKPKIPATFSHTKEIREKVRPILACWRCSCGETSPLSILKREMSDCSRSRIGFSV